MGTVPWEHGRERREHAPRRGRRADTVRRPGEAPAQPAPGQPVVRRLPTVSHPRPGDLAASFGALSEAVVIYDTDGVALWANSAAVAECGFDPTGLDAPSLARRLRLRHSDGRTVEPEDLPSTRALSRETLADDLFVYTTPRGRQGALRAAAWPLLNEGRLAGAVVVLYPATPGRAPGKSAGRIAGAVARARRHAAEAEAARRKAKRLVQRLHQRETQIDEYVQTITHDLRAPLTAILGRAQIIQIGADDPDCVRESAGVIVASARRMNALIQDLVDSARLESGQLQLSLEPVDLRLFVVDLLRRMAGAFDAGRVHLDAPEELPLVAADPDRLERVLVNIITNALKYSAPGSPIFISLVPGDGEVVAAVQDHGDGIPADDLPHVFDRFFRAKATRGQRDGLGLGLYISRGLIEAHRGRVWVTSEVGRGSTFYFTLPTA